MNKRLEEMMMMGLRAWKACLEQEILGRLELLWEHREEIDSGEGREVERGKERK